jgi:serine/threonine protein kinase
MGRCRQCSSEVEQTARFCSQCGSSLPSAASHAELSAADTIGAADALTSPIPRNLEAIKIAHVGKIRFVHGDLISDRYRIVSRVGRGGMGDVFRANDLTLGQPVALKFLSELNIDDFALERFRNEVRIARRISHPNICRVYDIGEVDGQLFLSMEYVDGEDLSSLLRRTGPLPRDRALEIARKICAGLVAAHNTGVLHRDLKPANIMLDARGEVRIMDFGLASLAHDIKDIRSGTPAYMAPEQFAGKEVTTSSDIYALGLVLFELFTGNRAFEGKTYDKLAQSRRENTPNRLSTLVRDLDPSIQLVIIRCLEEKPEDRPSSAIIISAALPGAEYLISIYRPDDYDPSAETQEMERDIDVLNDEMVAAGVRVFVAGLSSADHARSIRAQPNGDPIVTEGSYIKAKEHLLGFWVLKAADLDEALAWGRKAAKACRSSVEVRPFAYSN